MKLHFIKKKKKVGLTYRWLFLNEQSDLKKRERGFIESGLQDKSFVNKIIFLDMLNCL